VQFPRGVTESRTAPLRAPVDSGGTIVSWHARLQPAYGFTAAYDGLYDIHISPPVVPSRFYTSFAPILMQSGKPLFLDIASSNRIAWRQP
jgi:hypothetical protein